MKYCQVDGFRYPDGLTHCTACGAPLVSLDLLRGYPTTSRVVATSSCPNPLCRALVAPPQTNFCALCAHRLEPISFDLWVEKIAEPALKVNPVEVLLDPSNVLRAACELGLPLERAEAYLEKDLGQRTGLDRDAFVRLKSEALSRLEEGSDDLEVAKERVTEWTLERIPAAFALPLVERLSLEAFGEGGGAPSARPSVVHSRSDFQLPEPELADPVADGREASEARPAGDDAERQSPPIIIRRPKDEGREDEHRPQPGTAKPPPEGVVGGGASSTAARRQARRAPPTPDPERQADDVPPPRSRKHFIFRALFLTFILLQATVVPYLIWQRARAPARVRIEPSDSAGDAAEKATLSVYADMDGVSLSVDGVQSGLLAAGQVTSLSLPPGTHVVRGVMPRFPSWERRVELVAGARLLVPIVLRDQVPPSQGATSQAVWEARLLQMPATSYPAAAGSAGAATVWVEVMIDEHGNVSAVRVLEGPTQLQRAAIEAAHQSRFRPARRDGRAESDRQVMPVVFNPAQ